MLPHDMLYFMSYIYSLLNKIKFIYLEIKITMPTIPDEIFGRLTKNKCVFTI